MAVPRGLLVVRGLQGIANHSLRYVNGKPNLFQDQKIPWTNVVEAYYYVVIAETDKLFELIT